MLNPGIILSGQTANPVNAFSQGQLAGAQSAEIQNKNALRELLQSQGGNILAGDQNALNQLAGFDPAAAQGIQSGGLQIKQQEQALLNAKASAKRAAASAVANLSAQERAKESAILDRALAAASAATTPQQWDTVVQQFGAPDLVGEFGNRAVHIASVLGLKEALAQNTSDIPTSVRALQLRAEAAGLTPDTPEFKAFMLSGGKAQDSRIVFGPDGKPIIAEGAAATNPGKFTESEAKTNIFAVRAQGALEVLDPVAGALASRGNRIAGAIPFGLGRDFQDSDFQVAQQAGNEFLQAILRKDSGAAITQDEQDSYGVTYLPQPGDGPDVIANKADSRRRAIAAIKAGASPAQILAQERALQASGGQSDQSQSGTDFGTLSLTDLAKVDVTQLSGAPLDNFIAAIKAARGQ